MMNGLHLSKAACQSPLGWSMLSTEDALDVFVDSGSRQLGLFLLHKAYHAQCVD